MKERKSISIADQIFEQLERDILSGKYARGELLTELRLSEELGVSRTPIREAIRQLAPHIVTCHVHDNNGLSDQHLCPGLGTCDFDAVFEELAKCPRLQSVQNETSFHAGGTTIGHACRVFDGLMAKLGR